MTGLLAGIPSPSQGVWYLGPVPLRAYALCILLGIVLAVWLGDRRWRARGGRPGDVADVAVWAVPFGIVGGRLYHVISSPGAYFGPDGDLALVPQVWRGGLGIWGAVALGGVGAYIGARRAGLRFPALADALAPGILLAQAVGRWGNWFNQELFGGPTDLPWGLRIDPANRPPAFADVETFHPTFLYESLWSLAAVGVLLWADRRFRLGHGRVFWLYVVLYAAGRVWIELLRVDPASQVLGVRLNVWTASVVGLAALAALAWSARNRPGREDEVLVGGDDGSSPQGAAATSRDGPMSR